MHVLKMQVCLGPLQAQALAALAGAPSAVITPGLAALTARLASSPPEGNADDIAALVACECPLIAVLVEV